MSSQSLSLGLSWTPPWRRDAVAPVHPALPQDYNLTVIQLINDQIKKLTVATGTAPLILPRSLVVDQQEMVQVFTSITENLKSISGQPTKHRFIVKQVGKIIGKAMSRNVLGLYVPSWQSPRHAGLFVVKSAIEEKAHQMGIPPALLGEFVVNHEATHLWQFTAHPWLNAHFKYQLSSVIKLTERARVPGTEAIGIREEVLKSVQRMQAEMSLIEGYADFMAARFAPLRIKQLAAMLDERREHPGQHAFVQEVVKRLFGMEGKLSQYHAGNAFCNAVFAAGGDALLNRVWEGPAALPSPKEIADPTLWIQRMGGSSNFLPRAS
ncbi:MAG: zinc-dependent metalloprotease [Candidatus Dormibacteria bacterium]